MSLALKKIGKAAYIYVDQGEQRMDFLKSLLPQGSNTKRTAWVIMLLAVVKGVSDAGVLPAGASDWLTAHQDAIKTLLEGVALIFARNAISNVAQNTPK